MLLEDGFNITIASSNRERVEAAATELGDAYPVVGDVSVEADCRRIVATHQKRCGRLDVLVNSAGILRQGSLEALPVADWDRQFAVNVRGTFLMARLALPLLRASHGLIVNLASIAGKAAPASVPTAPPRPPSSCSPSHSTPNSSRTASARSRSAPGSSTPRWPASRPAPARK